MRKSWETPSGSVRARCIRYGSGGDGGGGGDGSGGGGDDEPCYILMPRWRSSYGILFKDA